MLTRPTKLFPSAKDIKRVKRGRGSVRVCVCVGMKERVSGKKWRIHTAESERLVVCSRLCECVHEKRESERKGRIPFSSQSLKRFCFPN